ncbi:hypothetical protein BKK80_34715 (plasmid) [Cupriavidus malaysiensis]|uniref:Uncharacterized protein n=1 Tax=Cupriavidus malaysiensis TaxID=367825 RepID=A0ABN4TVY9_9BURK|nr:hypothetical protein BKK80_34715 [Cupriavidus malaysiensis]
MHDSGAAESRHAHGMGHPSGEMTCGLVGPGLLCLAGLQQQHTGMGVTYTFRSGTNGCQDHCEALFTPSLVVVVSTHAMLSFQRVHDCVHGAIRNSGLLRDSA